MLSFRNPKSSIGIYEAIYGCLATFGCGKYLFKDEKWAHLKEGFEVQERESNTADKPHIKVLLIEDNEDDAEVILRFLSKAENIYFDIEYAALMSVGFELLEKKNFDVILSDLRLPDSEGVETLVKLHIRYPDIPMIVLTGLDDESTALAAVQSGAQDYLFKGRIDTSQLIRSIRYAIERQKLITELEKRRNEVKMASERQESLIVELQDALAKVKQLSGMLPICASCKKIRDDTGYWKQIESYISEHSDVLFSHGLCPDCAKKAMEELEKLKRDPFP